jgi:hypothetical protein
MDPDFALAALICELEERLLQPGARQSARDVADLPAAQFHLEIDRRSMAKLQNERRRWRNCWLPVPCSSPETRQSSRCLYWRRF